VARPLHSIYAFFGLFLTIGYAMLVSIPIVPFAVIPRGRRERYSIHGARLFAWLNLNPLLFIRKTVIGEENVPKDRGCLVVCNHRSWTDVPMLMLHTWSQDISKKEVAYVPFFGLNGYLTGAIFFDRKKQDARAAVVREAVDMMGKGAKLHLFPEGTRTRDGRLRTKIHLRVVEECWKAGIDVVPAAVWGTERVLPVGSFRAVPFQRCGLEIGAPLRREDFQSAEAYAQATWARVVEIARAHGADEPYAEEP
jgi:1-acyl-sn-glycerol-3-phosphate acyltransferase